VPLLFGQICSEYNNKGGLIALHMIDYHHVKVYGKVKITKLTE
jgi:hypothetical protein